MGKRTADGRSWSKKISVHGPNATVRFVQDAFIRTRSSLCVLMFSCFSWRFLRLGLLVPPERGLSGIDESLACRNIDMEEELGEIIICEGMN
jgi:hypothetical protein